MLPSAWTSPFPRPTLILGQANPFEEAPPPETAPAPRRMSFSDLKQGLRDYQGGKVDGSDFRNGILGLLAVLAVVALIVHLRQRRQKPTLPDNVARLGREIARMVRFPLGTKLLLKWVAHSTRTPFASLMLSEGLFDKCLAEWAAQSTFSVARHWGRARLVRLRAVLFATT